MRRTVGAQLECQEPKANISLPALGDEGPHDRIVLGGVLRVVPALVLLRGRRRAAPRSERRRRRMAQPPCTASTQRLAQRSWNTGYEEIPEGNARGRRETLEQERVLEESHGDDGAEAAVVALLRGYTKRKKGLKAALHFERPSAVGSRLGRLGLSRPSLL